MTLEEFDARNRAVNGALLKKLPLILSIPVAAIVVIYEFARHPNGASVRYSDVMMGVIVVGGALGMSAIMSRLNCARRVMSLRPHSHRRRGFAVLVEAEMLKTPLLQILCKANGELIF